MPTFATSLDRAKIDQLMQPALIRVIDNIRKQLDQVSWKGGYEEKLIWPEGTTPEQQQEYAALQKVLHGVPPEEHDRVAALMSKLPQPSPIYTLRLKKDNHDDQTVDIWALCYRVCTVTSEIATDETNSAEQLKADEHLFDESGEVDWRMLDDKTKQLVEGIFEQLTD
ncbi:MAG: hypothetical protein AAFQ63_16295 [Cyanobacteria bacterium J06621_11]